MQALLRVGSLAWRPSDDLELELDTRWNNGNKVNGSSSNSLELPAVAVVAELPPLLALLLLLCLHVLRGLLVLRGLHDLVVVHVALQLRRALHWVVVGPAAGSRVLLVLRVQRLGRLVGLG